MTIKIAFNPVALGVPSSSYFEKIWLTGTDNVEKAALTYNPNTGLYVPSGDWSWPVGGQFRLWVRSHAVNSSGNNWTIGATALLLSPAQYVEEMSRWNNIATTNNPAIVNFDLNYKRDGNLDNNIVVPNVSENTVFTYRIKLWGHDEYSFDQPPELSKW
ncbi:MAG: hypothetical protein PHU23_00120 [Dehalococcoidales bacterium]|nr:hypothetical protein [Dehalococcoidales bacterium]